MNVIMIVYYVQNEDPGPKNICWLQRFIHLSILALNSGSCWPTCEPFKLLFEEQKKSRWVKICDYQASLQGLRFSSWIRLIKTDILARTC